MKHFKRISKNFYLLFILPIVLAISSYILGRAIIAPKKYEKIELLISCIDLNDKKLETALLDSNQIDVKEINITFSVFGSDSMNLVYNTVSNEMDLIIMPESFFVENLAYNYLKYAPIDNAIISEYLDKAEYYVYDDKNYGIKVYDSISKSGWCDSIINYNNEYFNEDYYLFFMNDSINLGSLNNSITNNALKFIKVMSEYGK